jgi:hypothetical protein
MKVFDARLIGVVPGCRPSFQYRPQKWRRYGDGALNLWTELLVYLECQETGVDFGPRRDRNWPKAVIMSPPDAIQGRRSRRQVFRVGKMGAWI